MKLVLIISKIVSFILTKMGRGSSFPGEFAYFLNKRILNYFKLPKQVIAITGSAGKGSTLNIVVDVLEKNNKTVICNKMGSNLLFGVLSTIIQNSDLKGNVKADYLVLEVDERFTKKVFDFVKPNYVIITNICRDQPPRHGNVDLVLEKIKEALNPSMNILLNADDPYLRKIDLDNKYNIIYYGINENKLSYKENKFNSLNIYYCPYCNSKLNYNYYHIDSLGDYYCSKCDFKRPKALYLASEIDLDKNYMIINNKKVKIAFNILYYAYNILSSFALCSLLGIDEDIIANTISNMQSNKKLNDSYIYKNHKVYVLNNKNEDNITFNQSILFAANKKKKRTIVIGWKEISRRYKYNDMSWLYDIEFELLNDKYTKEVICVGRDRYDIAVRMKYAGFNSKQIKIFEDLNKAKKQIKSSKNDIFAIVNFDYVKPFNDLMKEE